MVKIVQHDLHSINVRMIRLVQFLCQEKTGGSFSSSPKKRIKRCKSSHAS